MTNELEPLKECPFCGGEAELVEAGKVAFVICKKCDAHSKTVNSFHPRIAIKNWNRRHKRTCKWTQKYDGEYYDTECGAKLFWDGARPPKCMYCGDDVADGD